MRVLTNPTFRLLVAIALIAMASLLVVLVTVAFLAPGLAPGLQTYNCGVPNSSGQLPPGGPPGCQP
jgi:hypothetical protein